jgi:H+/Cl- antiporter ClcA
MKNIKISDVIVILLIIVLCVSAAVLIAVFGMVKGGTTVTPEQAQVRMKVIDLLFIMIGIVGTSLGAIIQAKYGTSKEVKP